MEEQLMQYGVLGIWTVFNISLIMYYLKRDKSSDDKIIQVIENNTIAMTRVYESMRICQRGGR